MPENPFEVLRLPPDTDLEEAVRQAARLCQRAGEEGTRNAARQAIQLLTASAAERPLHALLTHPRPEHASGELDRLIAAHRRPPTAVLEPVVPEVDLEELRGLLLDVLADELVVGPMLLEHVDPCEAADEITRQTAEALWQGLLVDLRA